jgi:eukaryotic-like serine/threonine-protein kinase
VFEPNSRLGRFLIQGPIGRGRPDGLFAATDDTGRQYALRPLVADTDESGTAVVNRFASEARSLCNLAHLNVVPVFDLLIEQGHVIAIMERVPGRTLRHAMDDDQIGPRRALVILRQILQACQAAHGVGVIHRDLQPRRVLLVPMQGWELVKVADFGLAPMRDEAMLEFGAGALPGALRGGVAAYMAPEQVRGRSTDQRTDIYAVGTILFEMLAGRPPFPDSDPQLVMHLQLTQPPPRLEELFAGESWVLPEILALVDGSLAKEREGRFQTAGKMIEAVDAAFAAIEHLPGE